MNVVALYKHYWPDTTPYARILRGILEHWAHRGHRVSIITAQPHYNDIQQERQPKKEILNGVVVYRIPLLKERKDRYIVRAINYGWYLAVSFCAILFFRKTSLIIANGYPAVFMGVTLRAIRRCFGIPYIYHCQDIHPESMGVLQKRGKGFLFRMLQAIDGKNVGRAAVVVTLSEDMARSLRARRTATAPIRIVSNYILDTYYTYDKTTPVGLLRKENDDFLVLFAGNIGRFQGLHYVVAAWRRFAGKGNIKLVFLGEGKAKQDLIRQSGDLVDKTIFFLPFMPVEAAGKAMEEADLGLISLEHEIYKYAYPSKTMNYFAAGCPVLALIEQQSDLAKKVAADRLGYTCPIENEALVAQTVSRAWEERAALRGQREALRAYAQKEYGRERILECWEALLQEYAR